MSMEVRQFSINLILPQSEILRKYDFRGAEVEKTQKNTIFFVKNNKKCYPTSYYHP